MNIRIFLAALLLSIPVLKADQETEAPLVIQIPDAPAAGGLIFDNQRLDWEAFEHRIERFHEMFGRGTTPVVIQFSDLVSPMTLRKASIVSSRYFDHRVQPGRVQPGSEP